MAEWHPLRSYDGENGNGMNEDDEKFKSWNQLNQLAIDKGKIMTTAPAIMPTLDHSSMDDYQHVYEPSDDTFLLIDAMKYDLFSEYPLDLNDLDDDDDDNGNGNDNDNDNDNEEELIHNAALVEFYRQQQLPEKIINNNSINNNNNNNNNNSDDDDDKVGKRNSKILSRLEQLQKLERINDVVMELGTGSGIPITYLTKRLLIEKPNSLSSSLRKKTKTNDNDDDDNDDNNEDISSYSGTGISVIATDLNPFALQFAQRTAEENGIVGIEDVNDTNDDNDNDNEKNNNNIRRRNNNYIQKIEFIECNLAQPLLNRLEHKVDIILFNPPYVPTEDTEIDGNDIEISWAGGINGRKIIDASLQQIATLLTKPDGICYMITVDDNLPHELSTILHNDYKLHMIPLMRRRASNEYLTVQKITWL